MTQRKTPATDGYDAVQLGFKDKARNKASRAERGHVSNSMESKRRKARSGADIPKKADVEPQRHVREFRLYPHTRLRYLFLADGQVVAELLSPTADAILEQVKKLGS